MSKSKSIKFGRTRRPRVQHLDGDTSCQNTVCHEAPYHSKKWVGAEEVGIRGYICCLAHGNMLAIEDDMNGSGGEFSCVFCECCRGTCMDSAYVEAGVACQTCGQIKKEGGR